jgi:hypothetical protein
MADSFRDGMRRRRDGAVAALADLVEMQRNFSDAALVVVDGI